MAEQTNQLNNHVEDKIDAYALGILEDEEVAEVESHLEQCAYCRSLLQHAREVVGMLALAPRQVAPPPHLRQRILARIAQEEQSDGAPGNTAGQGARPVPRFGDEQQDGEISSTVGVPLPAPDLERQGIVDTLRHWFAGRRATPPPHVHVPGREQASEQQLQLILRLLHAPHASIWELPGTREAPHARACLLGSPEENEAVLVVSGLEPLPPERDYQLWFLREGQPVGSAVFDVHRSGEGQVIVRAPRQIGHYDLAAITAEPAGGSPGPTGPIMIAGEIKAA